MDYTTTIQRMGHDNREDGLNHHYMGEELYDKTMNDGLQSSNCGYDFHLQKLIL